MNDCLAMAPSLCYNQNNNPPDGKTTNQMSATAEIGGNTSPHLVP